MELSRNLRVESVSRLGPTPPRVLDVRSTVADAVALLREERVGCLLVTRDGKLVGIFTERDLLLRVLCPGNDLSLPLAICMTPDPVTVSPLEPVRAAVQRMQAGGYRHLPVVDDERRPVGVLSAKRVINYLVEHFPGTVYNLPPEPDNNIPTAPEGA